MAANIRYCTSVDGVRIAYSVEGDGPALVECTAQWESALANENRWLHDAYGRVRKGRRVVRYSPRGVELSNREPASFAHDLMVSDLAAVVRSAALERFALFGSLFSVAWAIDYAAHHPDEVERLILTRGASRPSDVMSRDNVESLVALIRSNWDMASQVFSDMGTRETSPEWGVPGAAEIRANITASAAAKWMVDIFASTDVSSLLPSVQCPTLILHKTGDTTVPFSFAQELAAQIPNARLVALPGSGMISLGGDVDATMQAIIDFLDEGRTTEPARIENNQAGAFRTVLFTDIVGHTEMMQRLGDEKGRDVLREHERITRELLKAHGGAEVKTMGDGFMASFGSITKAMDCAIALQRAFAAHTESMPEPLHVRVGLNAGEPIEEDGDLFGATVILASRIAAKAGAGEILIPEPVRHLLSGKTFTFSDRGEYEMKGFDDAVRLYEVRWRE